MIGIYIKHLLQRIGYDIRIHRPLYELVLRPLHIQVILDIGANDGKYSEEMLALFPDAHIYGFEPLPQCIEKLKKLEHKNSRFKVLPFALGATNETRTMEQNVFHPSSSLLQMSELHKELYPKAHSSTQETIEVKRLDDISPSLNLPQSFFVKIDVQGFEDKVLEGGRETLKKASALIIETSFYPLYKDQPLTTDIIKQASELGFFYYGALHTHHSSKTGRPLYEDSLFIHTSVLERFTQAESAHATSAQ